MKTQKNNSKLNGKDLINVGIFTAVYFVLNLMVAIVLGLIPVVSMLIPLISSFLLGIPMILYFSKIKKFGMILITYLVYGLILTLAGVGYYTLILGTITALFAELLLRSGNYENINRAILAFAVTSVGANANSLQMMNASTEYLEGKAAAYGTDYMNLLQGVYDSWWLIPVVILTAFIGGLLGGLLGKAVFKKHFLKSGMI